MGFRSLHSVSTFFSTSEVVELKDYFNVVLVREKMVLKSDAAVAAAAGTGGDGKGAQQEDRESDTVLVEFAEKVLVAREKQN